MLYTFGEFYPCTPLCIIRVCISILFLFFFFSPYQVVTNCRRRAVVCTRVEVDHYYRNLTSPKKRKMYVKNDFPPARGRSRSWLVVCFETTAATVKGVCVYVHVYTRIPHRRVYLCMFCVCAVVVVVTDSGGGLLPAFPGRFSHQHGIYVSYINSEQPQYQYHYQSFHRLINNIVPIYKQKYGFLNFGKYNL